MTFKYLQICLSDIKFESMYYICKFSFTVLLPMQLLRTKQARLAIQLATPRQAPTPHSVQQDLPMTQAIRQLQLQQQLIPQQQELIQVQQHLPHMTMATVAPLRLLLLLQRLHMTLPRLTTHSHHLLQPTLVQTLTITVR